MPFFGPSTALFFLLPQLIFGAAFLVILLVVVFYIGRRTPDPRGRRPYAAYLFSLIFVGVLAALAAAGFVSHTIAGSVAQTGGFESQCFVSDAVPPDFVRPSIAPVKPFPTVRGEFSPIPFPSFNFTIKPFPLPSFSSAAREISPQEVECDGGDPRRRARGIRAGIYAVAAGALTLRAGRAAHTLMTKEASDG